MTQIVLSILNALIIRFPTMDIKELIDEAFELSEYFNKKACDADMDNIRHQVNLVKLLEMQTVINTRIEEIKKSMTGE